MDTNLPTRTLTYTQIMANSFKLYQSSFSKVIWLSFILALITFTPRFIVLFTGQDIFRAASWLSFNKLFLILINIIGLMFFIGILWRMHCVTIGEKETLKDDLKMGTRRVIAVFFAGLLQTLLAFGVMMLVFLMQLMLFKYNFNEINNTFGMIVTILVYFAEFLLIVYCVTLFIFMLPIIAVENQGIMRALEKSVQLVWDHWWKVFSVQMTPWICYLLALSLLRYLLHIDLHIYLIARGVHTPVASIINLILFTLFIPWLSAILLVQLSDLEYRKKILSRNES